MMSDEDGLSMSLSTRATSLLRGPIVAAKSAKASMEGVTYSGNSMTTSNNRAGMENDNTPSKACEEYLSAHEPMLTNNPSAPREVFILSTKKQASSNFESSAGMATNAGRAVPCIME